MENRTLVLLIFVWWFAGYSNSAAQTLKPISIGLELQAYPAGLITGIRGDLKFSSQWSGNFRAGYNFARRGDLGEHHNETGGGFGASLGTRYYFKENYQGVFLGIRSDIWLMSIDWEDQLPNEDIRTGTTEITVVQPMAEGGYTFLFGSGNWSLSLKISLGFEVNIRTQGEGVGEGPISLLGLTLNKRL